MEHLDKYNLSSQQHGFRSNRSCLTQLLEYFLEVHDMLDEPGTKGVDAIYLDCKKAFDTVPHKRLMAKLEAYGISGKILRWIKSFLTDRSQKVCIKGVLSDSLPVLSGVPQGSVIGPLLFLIYINDLLDKVRSNGKLFADDSKIYRIIKDMEDRDRLQEDIMKLQEWSQKWLLEFNESKCKVMHISVRNTNPRYDYYMNGLKLQETNMEKDLGVFVTPNWKSSAHVAKVAARANSMVGRIRHAFTYMNKEIFLKVYPSMVRTHMEYAVQAWSPQLQKDIKILENVQRRATRIVPELYGLSYDQRLMELSLTSLCRRRLRGDMIEVYKIVHGFDNLDRAKFFKFKREVHSYNTMGHNFHIVGKFPRRTLRKGFFDIRVIEGWNRLPSKVVNCQSIGSFKRAYDKLSERGTYEP